MQSFKSIVMPFQTVAGDWSIGSSLTFADAHANLSAKVLQLRIDEGFKGRAPNTWLVSGRLIARLIQFSNLAAGGSTNGLSWFKGLMAELGITRIIEVPEFDQSPRTANNAMSLLCNIPNDQGIRQVVAALPAPVRQTAGRYGDETLFAMRLGGVNCPNTVSNGILEFQVRS